VNVQWWRVEEGTFGSTYKNTPLRALEGLRLHQAPPSTSTAYGRKLTNRGFTRHLHEVYLRPRRRLADAGAEVAFCASLRDRRLSGGMCVA
jgi:hypothetical protein